jgi:hypothetical protein
MLITKQLGKFAKEHRKELLVFGAVALVASGHLEFIPWTVAGALELIGAGAAAAGIAVTIENKLEDKSK